MIISVFTHRVSNGQFSASAQASPDDIKSNFPPTRLGVNVRSVHENSAALRCARKAVAILKPYMLPLTAVKRIASGFWIVEFRQKERAQV